MNILFVINALSPGGAEVFLYRLSEAFQANGNNVYVLPLHQEKNNESFVTLFKNSNIKLLSAYNKPSASREKLFWKINAFFYKLGVKGIYNIFRNIDKKVYYKRLLKEYRINLINSHLIESDNFAVNYLKKITGIPVVITMHGSYNESNIAENEHTENYLKVCLSVLNNANYIIYVAEVNTYLFSQIITPSKKIYLGYKPTGKTDEKTNLSLGKIKPNSFVFGMIGRGIPEKGWQIAIDAFEQLNSEFANLQLVLVGPETEYIKMLKDKYVKNKNILFTGQLDNPEPIIRRFNVSLLPSYSENLPVSIIEALSFGIPVLATDVGEIKTMLTDDGGSVAGACIPLAESGLPSVSHLYENMKHYLTSNAEFLQRQKEVALNAAKKFSMEDCAKQYIDVYNIVLNKNA